MTEPKEDPFAETRMTLGEHLDELRSRLIKGVSAVLVAFLFAWIFREQISGIVLRPYQQSMDMLETHFTEQAEKILEQDPERERTDFFITGAADDDRLRGFDRRASSIKPGESFFFTLKICLYFAVFIGSPILLWQMWQFVAAGLYRKEKGMVLRFFPLSVVFFVVGVSFGYFVMVPYAMYFLNKESSIELMVTNITLEYFLGFISSLCLAFGGVFQLPLLMSFLGAAGVVEPEVFSRYRGHFIVGGFFMAAMLTPPDPYTQLMMGLPLIVLYEIGVWGARFTSRRRRARSALPVPARPGDPSEQGEQGEAGGA